MNDIKPKFQSYEDLANSTLSDNTLVYPDAEGVKYRETEAGGFFSGSSVETEEAVSHKKSREYFHTALAEKFEGVTKLEDQESPLTLGHIRAVIKEESLKEYEKKNVQDSVLARLMGAAIMAKEEAERASAYLDILGYPKGHLEKSISAVQGLLLNAGITTAVVGAASYAAITALMAASSGVAATTLVGSIPTMMRSHTSSNENVPAAEGIIAHTIIAELAVAVVTNATMLISPQAAAGHAIIQSIPSAVAMLGLTTEKGTEIGRKLASFLPSVATSFEDTQLAVSQLTAAQRALLHAITKRVVANQCLEAVKEYTKEKTGVLISALEAGDALEQETHESIVPSTQVTALAAKLEADHIALSKLTQDSSDQIKEFQQINKKTFEQKLEPQKIFQGIVERLQRINTLLPTEGAILLTEEHVHQIRDLAQENLHALKSLSGNLSRNYLVGGFKNQANELLRLIQEIQKIIIPEEQAIPLEEITVCYEDFFKAVNAGLKTGSEEIKKLRNESLSAEGTRSEAEQKKALSKPYYAQLKGRF